MTRSKRSVFTSWLVSWSIFFLFPTILCAQGIEHLLPKQVWVVAGGSCPVGCSSGVKGFISDIKGGKVTISDAVYSTPFGSECAGKPKYVTQVLPAHDVAQKFSEGLDSKHRFTPANMRLGHGPLTTVMVLCPNDDGSYSVRNWLLSVKPSEVDVLFEEQSIIVLR